MKKLLNIIVIIFISFITFILPNQTHAAVDISKEYGFGDITSLGQGINRLVPAAFSIATTAVVIYFVYAAFKYTTSGGDKEEVANAQKMITHSVIGFVLLMFLFLFVEFLFGRLFGINIQLFQGIRP